MTAKDILRRNQLDKTYWGKRIINAEARGSFNRWDVRMARGWTTCACGKLGDRMPRICGMTPVDDELYDLGCDFSHQVVRNLFALAARILVAIEKRSEKVLIEVAAGRCISEGQM
jgi:hypothetical protein